MRVGSTIAAAIVVSATIGAGAADGRSTRTLDWDRVFAVDGEPASLHYVAVYRARGTEHRLEVWRDGERRIRRRTDDAIDTVLVREPGSDDWSMTVFDRTRRIRTDVTRTNLVRIGRFVDWFSQGHALVRPVGTYALTGRPDAAPPADAIGPCRWYRLAEAGRTSDVCWSAVHRIPLAIAERDGTVVWRVVRASSEPIAPTVFAVDDSGYARTDANADIEKD